MLWCGRFFTIRCKRQRGQTIGVLHSLRSERHMMHIHLLNSNLSFSSLLIYVLMRQELFNWKTAHCVKLMFKSLAHLKRKHFNWNTRHSNINTFLFSHHGSNCCWTEKWCAMLWLGNCLFPIKLLQKSQIYNCG